jgi:hypothetical protein
MFIKLNTTARILTAFLLALAIPHRLAAAGPDPVDLRSTANFAILAGAAITTTGGGTINGDVGASPIAGSAIGVTCAQVNGIIYAVDAAGPACAVIDPIRLTAAKGDLTTAYNDAAGRTPVPTGPNLNPGLTPGAGNIGGMNLAPGLYKFTVTALITGSDVTLTGGPDDVWIFQCAQDLQLGSGIKVILAGGAQAKNIFWQVGTSAVLGTSSVFKGTIMADQAITMNTSSTIEGRALAFSAGVTFNGTGLSVPTAPAPAPEIAVEQPPGTDLVDGVGSKNFGSVVVGANTSLTFTVTNLGTANLTGLGITIDGVDAALFSVTAPPTAPVIPSGSTTFTVRFAPVSPGLKTAALHIANNDSDENPFDITLTGTGTAVAAPEIAVEQPPGTDLVDGVGGKDFGLVVVGLNTSLTFTITNLGTANLTGLGITIDGVDAALFSVTANPTAPVIPSGSTTFTVRFAPVSPGLKTAALHIANNDSDENPFDITLTGTGTAVAAPEIAVEQPLGANLADGGSKDFGSVVVGANTSLTFTITNLGTADLTGLGITIDGADSAMFSVTANPTAPVSPSGSTTFTVRFAPASTGVKTAALHLANNDSDENPFDITLTGTGTGGVIVSTNVFVSAISPITLNPQTGLFEQTIRLTNSSPNAIAAVRLLIQDLPADVQVYNASGSTNGTPYLQYNLPLAPGAAVDFLIEYYRANRQAIPQPTFVAQEITPVSVTETGPVIAIGRNVQLESGRFLIEFSAIPGRRYAVQYSSDMTSWKTANPIITAPANRVQWYDDGPPKTESKPTAAGSRFYRIMELP